MGKNTAFRSDEGEFTNWLRHTADQLKHGELPPESWDLRHSPLEDSAAQRRIATLISRIAERQENWKPRRPRQR